MADLNKIVRRYEIQSDTSGLDKIAVASDKANAATGKLAATTSSLATSTDTASKSAISVAAQLDRLSKAADPAQKALAAVERQQRLIDAATKQGQPVREEWTNALAILKGRHEDLTKATHEHSASVGLNRVQLLEATHVAKSFADSLVAGASPLRALSLEGGRIAQIFAEGNGGVGGTLKAMGGTVARLATGWVGMSVAIVGGLAAAGAAVARFQGQQDRLAVSLNGSGRYAGTSLAGLTGIANAAGARNPYLGQGGATNLAASLASTGRISSGIMPGILDLATPYARGTGQDVTKAGEELAKAFADPGKGADQLNEKLGFLDDTTKRTIASLERQGDLLGAQQVLLTKAADAASQMADRTWTIAKAWGAIESGVGATFNAIGSGIERAVNGPSTASRLATLYGQQDQSFNGAVPFYRQFAGGNRAAQQSQILGLNYQLYGESRGESDTATRAAADKRTNDLSIQIGEAVRKAVPELDRSQELTDTLKLLADALGNPETLGKVKGGAGAVGLAYDRTQTMSSLSDPLLRIRQDNALSAQAAGADTAAERTLIEARRAELEVLRQTGDATQAASKSLGVWNDEIAKSNKEAEDAVRNSSRNLDMSMMRPYDRGRQEIINRYEDSRRNSVTGPLSSLSPDDLRMTALDPFGDLSSASAAFGGKRTDRIIPTMHARSLAAYRQLQPVAPGSSDVTVTGGATTPAIASYVPAARRFAPGNIVVPATGGNASTSTGNYARAQANDLAAYDNAQTLAKLQAANDELDRNKKLLDARTASIGKSTAEQLKAIHTQEDWNELQLTDNQIASLKPDLYQKISQAIDTNATKQTANDQQQLRLQQTGAAADYFQQTGSSVVGTLGTDLGGLFNAKPRDLVSQLKQGDQAKYYAGQLSGNAVKSKVFQAQAGNFLRNLAFQQGIGLVQKGLFGQGQFGSPGYQSGLLGGVFNSALGGIGGLFSGGGAALGAGGIGSDAVAGAAGAGGNIFSSLFSGLGHLFGFADGGIMTSAGALPLHRYATGGVANTPQLAMFGEGRGPEA